MLLVNIAYISNISLTVCSCHVTNAFQSESTLYSCLDVKELHARSRREIWRLSDCNWTQTQNHLVRKQTFNHLAKLSVRLRTKWFWVRVQLQSLSNINFMQVGLEILLLVCRTCRLLIETGSRLKMFLNLCHNCFSIWETLSMLHG